MPFPGSNQGSDRYYNNADSFAIAFDKAWKTYSAGEDNSQRSTEEILEIIIDRVKDHPFLDENQNRAMEIARFRIRLLGLR